MRYFHLTASGCKRNNHISSLTYNLDNIFYNELSISNCFVNCYSVSFAYGRVSSVDFVIGTLRYSLSVEDQAQLYRPFDSDKVVTALKQMGPIRLQVQMV